MAAKDTERTQLRLEETSNENSKATSNIERFLNNHTREGGHSWQSNMVARPVKWHTLSEDSSTEKAHS